MRAVHYFSFLVAGIFIFSACERHDLQESKSTLKINYSSEPPTLDHRKINYSIATNILPLLYDGLMRYGPDGQLKPSVARKVTISDDGKRYVFYLRRSAWSNGDPVTAYDFEYAWKWVLDPQNPAPLASHLYCLKNGRLAKEGKVAVSKVGVSALDSETLLVHLENPLPHFLELTTLYNFFPINHKRESEDDHVIGNGPFNLKEWDPQKRIILEKSGTYWDRQNVRIEQVSVSFIQDPNTELQLFNHHELDWAGAPNSTGLPFNALASLPSLETHPFLGTYFYAVNTTRPPLNNKKVRQALSQALDREEIVTHITQGGETPAYRFVPPAANFVTHNPKPKPGETRRLFNEGLHELGMKRRNLRPIQLSYNKNEMHHAIAQAVQNTWKEQLGIEVKLVNRDWKAHLSEVNAGNFDIARLTWKGLTSDPIHFLEIFQNPRHPMHHTEWTSDRFQRNLNGAVSAHDLDERLFYLAEAEDILTEEMPVIPLHHLTICYLRNPRLKGFVINQLGAIDYKWAYFEDDAISH